MYLTILIPALNEEDTIEIVIKKSQKIIKKMQIEAEILVVNNGSTDKTKQISEHMGARVIDVFNKGYGNALREGIKEAKGKYIIMGDADDSYNFLEIEEFVQKLEEGYDIVIGNRYGKKMEKGAMPFLHKYVGTPMISNLIKRRFHTKIKDVNCGLRGGKKQALMMLNCQAEGMEFASEMLIKAIKQKLKIVEIPIFFYKDKRTKKPHLRPIKDGIRHLRVIYKEK
ncbi:MAG: glycosyltransferase family 2 protein [Clostridia bacterium]